MTRILSSLFYISSMRKTSEEFNSEVVIQNIGNLCGNPDLEELPYWETINQYLKRLDPNGLQTVVCQLTRHLLRIRAFEDARIRGKYWQVILDGTQLQSSQDCLDPHCLYRVHKRGTPEEYREYFYYVVEAKLVLGPNLVVSILSEFLENEGSEMEKQDCEWKGGKRLMERLKQEFPRLPICLSADSLYACETFFQMCREYQWKYLLRFKEGSLPSVGQEYQTIRAIEKNRVEEKGEEGTCWYDFVTGIDYRDYPLNLIEYEEKEKRKTGKKKETGKKKKKPDRTHFFFLTDLAVSKKNVKETVMIGRRRWKIENEGFNTQKNYGYMLEHRFSNTYQGTKNHYYAIQIGHMISQILEARMDIWKKVPTSREQKHKRLLESWKQELLSNYQEELGIRFQLRFE